MSSNFLKRDLTLAHWTQVSDRCPLGYLFFNLLAYYFIGVLAQSTDPDERHLGDTYIPATYIKYIESAGARVVPVRLEI